MDTSTIYSTLAALDAFGGRIVVATDLSSAMEAVKPFTAMPCCVIHGLSERAADNRLSTGGPSQLVTVSIKILIVHRDVTDAFGAAAMVAVHTARVAEQAALQGLIPDTGYTETLMVGGQLAYAQAGTVMWLDEWRTSYYLG